MFSKWLEAFNFQNFLPLRPNHGGSSGDANLRKSPSLGLGMLACLHSFEINLSGFHKITVTVLKSYLEQIQPKNVSYRDFGKFSNNDFRTKVLQDFSILHLLNDFPYLDLYLNICIRVLDLYAPKKYLRANSSFLSLKLSLKQW